MRYPKHIIFISLLGIVLFSLSGCTDGNGPDNEGETDRPVSFTIHATMGTFSDLPATDPPHTRVAMDGLKNSFETGDAIGLFAIKNGTVVSENVKLTYNITDKKWSTGAGDTSLYGVEGADYVAYSPYKAGVTIADATQSKENIAAALADNDNLQPGKEQSTSAGFAGSDLMTASGSLASGSTPEQKILRLSFVHRFALVIIDPQKYTLCKAPASAGFAYKSGASVPTTHQEVVSATLDGGYKAFRMSDGTYRVLAKPTGSDSQIKGFYEIPSSVAAKRISFTGSTISGGLLAGHCYTVRVTNSTTTTDQIERPLAPGDFVYNASGNIEIYPGNGKLDTNGKIPGYATDAPIGIVITCDQTRMKDDDCTTNEWTHAYVMGLENTDSYMAKYKWGNAKIADLASYDRTGEVENYMNGYTETKYILDNLNPESYPAFNSVKSYRSSSSALSGMDCSGWFIPSSGQWYDVLVNLGGISPRTDFQTEEIVGWNDARYGNRTWNNINTYLNKIDKPLDKFSLAFASYWTSTQFKSTADNRAWVVLFGRNGSSNYIAFYAENMTSSTNLYIRPFFAF